MIKRADEILKTYESSRNKKQIVSQISMNFEENNTNNDKYVIISEKLKKVNPLETSPMEALNILYDLKKEMDKK